MSAMSRRRDEELDPITILLDSAARRITILLDSAARRQSPRILGNACKIMIPRHYYSVDEEDQDEPEEVHFIFSPEGLIVDAITDGEVVDTACVSYDDLVRLLLEVQS